MNNSSCVCSQAVEDATGREDLIEALRNALLVQTAARLGYNRVARGDNATRIAARVIAMSSKGAGFALPSCIQYYDARQGPSSLNQQDSQCSHRLLLPRFTTPSLARTPQDHAACMLGTWTAWQVRPMHPIQ